MSNECDLLVHKIEARSIAPDIFQSYGQVIYAVEDGKPYDQTDAQLVLSCGIPRFYLMRLFKPGRQFHKLTRHVECTQCLGSLAGKSWLIAVAPPGYPISLKSIVAFQIPGDCFIKLHQGTWHAGPYFEEDWIDFYNLELSNTNITDHDTYNFKTKANVAFEIVESGS